MDGGIISSSVGESWTLLCLCLTSLVTFSSLPPPPAILVLGEHIGLEVSHSIADVCMSYVCVPSVLN